MTSEPKVKAIRNGTKVAFYSSSLKMFNEDLNTLEVFVYAHDEVHKLSGQLLLDSADRLPNLLKRRYLDFLDKKHLDMRHPGFESLRDFVVHEIDMMTSECAQAFFKDEKEGTREQSSGAKVYRVRQVAVDVEDGTQDTRSSETHLSTSHARPATNKAVRTFRGRRLASKEKPPSKCFVCSQPECKHF